MASTQGAAGTVVVLPGNSAVRASLLEDLRASGGAVLDIDLPRAAAAPLTVRTCAAIVSARPAAPLLVVALGEGAELVPAVALAQRTAHRAVLGYVLVDPSEDPSAPDWPDAPVHVIATEAGSAALRRAALRGWTSETAQAAAVIAASIRALAR